MRSTATVAQARKVGLSSGAGRFLRLSDVMVTTGLGRSTIYRMVAAGTFPAQTKITAHSVGWWQADVDSWLAERRGISSKAA